MRVGTVAIANFAVSILQAKNPKNRCTAWIWILSVLFFLAIVCACVIYFGRYAVVRRAARSRFSEHTRETRWRKVVPANQPDSHTPNTHMHHIIRITEQKQLIHLWIVSRSRSLCAGGYMDGSSSSSSTTQNRMIRRLDKILSSSLSCRFLLRRDVELNARKMLRGAFMQFILVWKVCLCARVCRVREKFGKSREILQI